MAYGQKQLGQRFHRGETSGKASNVEILEFEELGITAVVGYGHAVYATRDIETGDIVYYDGWYGYSVSTSSQLTKLRLETNSDEVRPKQKKLGDLHRAEKSVRHGEEQTLV